MNREAEQAHIRLPDGLRDRIQIAAAANKRSMNAEMVVRLERDSDASACTPVIGGQSNFVKTALRLPPELHAEVHAAAEAEDRTYNAQLIHMLHRAQASLRDEFAGRALQGLLSGAMAWHDFDFRPVSGKSIMENNALCAYAQADAMLAVRGAT